MKKATGPKRRIEDPACGPFTQVMVGKPFMTAVKGAGIQRTGLREKPLTNGSRALPVSHLRFELVGIPL